MLKKEIDEANLRPEDCSVDQLSIKPST